MWFILPVAAEVQLSGLKNVDGDEIRSYIPAAILQVNPLLHFVLYLKLDMYENKLNVLHKALRLYCVINLKNIAQFLSYV